MFEMGGMFKLYALLSFLAIAAFAQTAVPVSLQGEAAANAGAQGRVMQRGLQHVRDVFITVLNTEIPNIQIPEQQAPLPLNAGYINLKSGKLSYYKKPVSQDMLVQPTDSVVWVTKGTEFDADAGFDSSWQKGTGNGAAASMISQLASQFATFIQNTGTVKASGRNVDINITSKIETSDDGVLQFTPTDCSAKFGSLKVTVKMDGMLGQLLNFQILQNAINKQAQPIATRMVCDSAKSFISKNMNAMLRLLTYQVPAIQGDPAGYPQLPQDLVLDFHLTRKPVVDTTTSVMSFHRAEISWQGKGQTPFNPAVLTFANASSKMADISASDYVTNSMLYHAYSQHLLDLTLNEQKTPSYKDYLQTRCLNPSNLMCIGNVLPELSISMTYPAQVAEMTLVPTQMPYVLAQPGKFQLFAEAITNLNLKSNSGSKDQVLSADTHLEADVKMDIRDKSGLQLYGNATVTKLEFKMRQTTLGPTVEARLNALSTLLSQFVSKILTDKLAQGFPVPKAPGVEFTNMSMQVLNRTMAISTDFKIDVNVMLSLAAQARPVV